QALQRTVVALVETPIAHHGDPVAVGGIQCQVGGADRTTQQRGVDHVGQNIVLHEQFAAALGLGLADGGQVDIHPSGELVGGVPRALSVTKKNQFSVSHNQQFATLTMVLLAESPKWATSDRKSVV